jgi:4-hydroxythreonine-4-phosphate dehydrogenase
MSSSAPQRISTELTLAVTPGEPAGIGPDIALALGAQDLGIRVAWVIDPTLLAARAATLGLQCEISEFDSSTPVHRAGHFAVLPVRLAAPVTAGKLDTANSAYVLQCLDQAIAGCLSGEFAAMVTGPVHKGVINDAGIPFTGHTEYLAAAADGARTVMMLATSRLRVALVTTHVPLVKVPSLIDSASVSFVLDTVARSMNDYFGIEHPRLSVCGLNPHAGEGGHMGREEIDHIVPALLKARDKGWQVTGPFPGDTAFTAEALDRTDAVVAMYHDQGLPVLKYASFGGGINITLGLPVIRTSVDHGTALELAGTGKAKAESLIAAIELAADLAVRSRCAG